MKNPTLSIILPIYNVETYLADCLNSILNQDFEHYEILAINDGSTDNSLDVCKIFARKDNRIKIFNQPNKGLSEARNKGIQEATGEYLLFVDSDDFLKNGALVNISEHIRNYSTDVIIGLLYKYYNENEIYTETFDFSNKEVLVCDKEVFVKKAFKNISWSAPKYIVRRKFVLDNSLKFKSGYLHEDVDWTTHLFLLAESFSFYNQPFYYHRMKRPGSIINIYSSKRAKDMIEITSELIELLNSEYKDFIFIEQVRSRLSESVFYYVSTIYFFKKEERKILLSLIEKNLIILKYSNKNSQRIFFKCIELFGLRPTLMLSFCIRKLSKK